jgi:hypothetical protein
MKKLFAALFLFGIMTTFTGCDTPKSTPAAKPAPAPSGTGDKDKGKAPM